MNKRIRKKKHAGEFNYKGFEVRCNYDKRLNLAGADAFMDGVIELAERNDLSIIGGFGPEASEFCVMRRRPSRPGARRRRGYTHCTESDRELVGDRLRAQPFMGDIFISELKGMWR